MSLEVSQMLDGELDGALLKRVLDAMVADAQRRDRYNVYGLISDALRGNSTPDDRFTQRILARIRNERSDRCHL
jgi:negative regulator of sigma E activity